MIADGVRLYSNGRYWKAAWHNSAGKPVHRSIGAKAKTSKAEALRKCREIAKELLLAPGRRDVQESPTLAAWRVRFLEQRGAHLTPGSVKLFRQTFAALEEHFGDVRLDRITKAEASNWRAALARRKIGDKTISETTVAKHTGNAKAIFGDALDQDLVAANPFSHLSSARPEIEKDWGYYDDGQMERLLASAPDPFYRAGLALCRYAGLRPNEMIRVTPADIDWTSKTLRVRAATQASGERKVTTKQRTRVVPIEPRLYAILQAAEAAMPTGKDAAPNLFQRDGKNNLVRDLHSLITRAGLPKVREPWKTMRKNCETDWQSRNPPLPPLDVAAWLGHDIRVSARHYHRTKSESLARVTGEGADIPSRLARLRAEIAELESASAKSVKIGE